VRRQNAIQPFATRGRATVAAILVMFALVSATSVTLTIRATERSRNRSAELQVAARQRTLAERYVEEILLARAGKQADPAALASIMHDSARVLLDGGTAPAVDGDDDDSVLTRATGSEVRSQLVQEQRLVTDLTATGRALLANQPVNTVPQTAREEISVTDPIERLRVLAGLTSNVSLNAARSIAQRTDRNVNSLILLQIALGIAGVLASFLLAWALIVATRRQTAHFRSLVTSSTDLVVVFGVDGCRYVSASVVEMLGSTEQDLLGAGFMEHVHADDRARVSAAYTDGGVPEVAFLLANRFGEWRHVDAHVSDLRADRQIRGVVFNGRDISERVQLEEELGHQAFHDGLTDLANRSLFHDRLDQSLVRSARSHEPLTVLLVDLDRFKQVNDSLGHSVGDALLQQLARRLGRMTRADDTLARLGGDEFAVLLDGADESESVAIAHRYIDQLREPVMVGDHELVFSASVGIATHPGGPGTSEELIRRADMAMYAAKRSGGGHCEVFQPDMARALGELVGLEHEIRQGLQRGEFSVHYQPEIDLATNAIVGVEALVRWFSPTRGTVMPDQFIGVAESSELIQALGEFVLRAAVAQTAAWRRDHLVPEPFITWVNLSGKQLSKGGVSTLVRAVLDEARLPATYLGLEVTETALAIQGVAGDRARTELEEIHALGVRIAIDDFGTGFSSLEQLRRFPIDVIKVDRSFIQGDDAKSTTITANVTSLAHALGLVAVAEGIETEGQLTSAKALGCDLAQGYLFTRPAPAADVTQMFVSRRDSRIPGVPVPAPMASPARGVR
jgi:diguanylate cyclase (GGDEF)-like protein/PAS domain S-box-containing protein